MLARNFTKVLQRTSTISIATRGMSTIDTDWYITDKADQKCTELPVVPKRGSYKINMEEGKTYFWCTCGRSETQPWCDGKHRGTEFKPYKFTWEEPDKKQSICGCKLNRDDRGAKCDRSHRLVDFENLEDLKPGF